MVNNHLAGYGTIAWWRIYLQSILSGNLICTLRIMYTNVHGDVLKEVLPRSAIN